MAEIQDIFGIWAQICDKKGEYNVPVIHIENLLSVNYFIKIHYFIHAEQVEENN